VKRFATATVALLALVALVTAAGSFDPTDQPQIDADSTPPPEQPRAVSPNGSPNERTHSETQSSNLVDGETRAPPDTGDGGGVSSLVVAALVGGLAVAAVLAVALTGDDTHAPLRDDGDQADDGSEPMIPAVEPAYDSPSDNPAVRAWRRLADRVEGVDDSTTPREVASIAVDRGFPAGAVDGITSQFETVRYGGESPTGARGRRADELVDRLDASTAHDTGTSEREDAVPEGGDET